MSITVTNITKLYGTQKALDGVSLQVRPGEIIGLLGPNGAGKSTLMKILTCFIPPTSGDASVCGFDVIEQSIEVRKRVGYLPENNPLYLDLYVREFLAFIAGLDHGQVKGQKSKIKTDFAKRIPEIIELTGLGAEQHKKIGALSKGYRQRVGLAQALLHDPEVLILDEPTSGLDPNQLLEIRSLIKEIGKKKTVMLSTHIMQEVEAICDRAVIIHKGIIIADDSTHNLHSIATSKAVVRVEFSAPVSPALLRKIQGVKEVMPPEELKNAPVNSGKESSIWFLTSEAGSDIRGDVFRFAVDNGLTVLSLHREEQKLEEVFQELTRG
jgi:ABC-2 type transport system ATP-binding protein